MLVAAFVFCTVTLSWTEVILHWQSLNVFRFSAGSRYSIVAHVADHKLCGWRPLHSWSPTCQWLHPGIQLVLEEKRAEKC